MLTSLSEDVADCYRRAAECQELARLATNDKDREFYRDRENDWLVLARTHQFAERMGRAINEKELLLNADGEVGTLAEGVVHPTAASAATKPSTSAAASPLE